MAKRNKIFSGLLVIGLLAIATMYVYYHFHLGIKPCKGLPTDASNCGDADFGGIYFLLAGIPLVLTGIIGLIISVFTKRNK